MKRVKKTAGKIVRWEPQAERPLSDTERAELDSLAMLPEERIDTSDAPELPDAVWRAGAVRGRFYRPVKRPVTMRLDADVIEWLKSKAGPQGRGYQTTANRLLRARMIAELRTRYKTAK
jgi:uncharacterized protein (DUF4415 family)